MYVDLCHTEKNGYIGYVLHKFRSWWIIFKRDDYNFYSEFGSADVIILTCAKSLSLIDLI
jgi:hypothetical protein